MTDPLSENLRDLASSVTQVDLRDRVLAGSRRAARRRRAVVVGSAMALLVGLASAAFALPGGDAPRSGATPSATTPATAKENDVLPLPSAPPPTVAGPWPGGADPVPDRSLDGLRVPVPAWPGADLSRSCSGDVVLAGGRYPFPTGAIRQLRLVKATAYGDDGVVALFFCELGQLGRQYQVVDYRRVSGALLVRGQVLVSRPEGVQAMFDVAVAGSAIRVEVGDWANSATIDEASHYSVRQWRGYSWNGTGFAQVEGPTTFAPNPNFYDVGITSTDLSLGPPDSAGTRTGTVKLTIHNKGPGRSPGTIVELSGISPLRWRADATTACPGGRWRNEAVNGDGLACDVGPVGAGATVVLTVGFSLDASQPLAMGGWAELSPSRGDMTDTNRDNDRESFAVSR